LREGRIFSGEFGESRLWHRKEATAAQGHKRPERIERGRGTTGAVKTERYPLEERGPLAIDGKTKHVFRRRTGKQTWRDGEGKRFLAEGDLPYTNSIKMRKGERERKRFSKN